MYQFIQHGSLPKGSENSWQEMSRYETSKW